MSNAEPQRSMSLFYGLTLFLSAGLLFAVQPLLGKQMLPLVGGSPSGWLTALAFFQMALLVGYLVAHGLSRLSARRQAWATAGLLVVGAVFLPPRLTADAGMNVGSVWAVLGLLFQGIFLPYVGLATVSSGLQRLYAERSGGRDPYFLYAASNAGSFAGLLAYPLIVEPLLPLSTQGIVWAVGYGLLIAMIGLLTWGKGAAEAATPSQAESTLATASQVETISWGRRGQWVLLAFIPSSLSMGLTALVTADFGSLPLFWVIPLGLYLLTFVFAFSERHLVSQTWLNRVRLLAIVALLLLFLRGNNLLIRDWYLVAIPIIAFFSTALWCHRHLAERRPSARLLTQFYLWLSLGGALGGVFNAFIVPYIFSHAVEFVVILLVSALLSPRSQNLPRFVGENKNVHAVLAGLLCAVYMALRDTQGFNAPLTLAAYLSAGAGLVCMTLLPRQFFVLGLFTLGMVSALIQGAGQLAAARNFYGTYAVADAPSTTGKTYRMFYHGAMVEGMQIVGPTAVSEPRIYFFPLHDLFREYKYKDVAMLGFGTGTALCFNDGTQRYTAYEINPLVIDLARQWFTYLSACGEPRWRIGDARLLMAQDTTERYDLLFLDAFSSASIPQQLITREALELYRSRLKPTGMMVWNVNSLYYDLAPPLAAMAYDMGWQAWKRYDEIGDRAQDITGSHFVLLAPSDRDLSALRNYGWEQLGKPDFPVWRDDFSNTLLALKVIRNAKTQ